MKHFAHVTAQELEAQSRFLDRQIKKLDKRGSHITPPEYRRAVELKKLRLVAKDLLRLREDQRAEG
jgi:hypothetical protein